MKEGQGGEERHVNAAHVCKLSLFEVDYRTIEPNRKTEDATKTLNGAGTPHLETEDRIRLRIVKGAFFVLLFRPGLITFPGGPKIH
jgi:hypothetical protein